MNVPATTELRLRGFRAPGAVRSDHLLTGEHATAVSAQVSDNPTDKIAGLRLQDTIA
ncbi:MAG: hypothetical protein JSW71_10185 [Gemmatimonadota bacterium]|nr:MAG: hypothetical protein JSW71_10185 [Gemmatimonadota bacterium]